MLICLFTCDESLCPYTCTPKADYKNNPVKDGDFGNARKQPAEMLLAEQARLGSPWTSRHCQGLRGVNVDARRMQCPRHPSASL